jgi:glycine/D-amino acid oxidase-like deaminating enzyme
VSVEPTPLYAEPPASADLVIVGGGIVGAATAFFAARAGLRTVLLEKRPALCSLTTPASTGAFRLQFDNPEEIALVREGVAVFDRFAEVTGLDGYDLDLRHQGYLFCACGEAAAERQRGWVAAQRTWGLDDVEILSGDEVRYRFPYVGPAVVQARYRAADGWLDVRQLTMGYAAASRATICLETPALGFIQRGDRLQGVLTPRGAIACEQVVVAAGPFSGRVASLAGLSLPIRPTVRQKLVLPDLPEVPPWAPMTIDEETAAHWRPGLGGAFALWTDPRTPPSEPTDNVPISSDWAFALLDPAAEHSLARVSPFWSQVWRRNRAYWLLQAGQYEYTPDHRPLLGPTSLPGLHVNTGYSGHGIMASTGGSRLVVDLLLGHADPAANPFRHDRAMPVRPLDIL